MRKEFVIKRIDASPDGAPYVIISLTSSKDLQDGNKNRKLFCVFFSFLKIIFSVQKKSHKNS